MARKTLKQVEEELENLKQRVITATMEHPSGCTSGKRAFLRDVGLSADADLEGQYVFTVKLDLSEDEIDSISEDHGADFYNVVEFTSYLRKNWEAEFDNGNWVGYIDSVTRV